MAYQIRFYEGAKQELEACRQTYSPHDAKKIDDWLMDIAEASELGNESISQDAFELLEELEKEKGEWKCSWDHWKAADGTQKLKALLKVLRTRKPPWRYRMTMRWFSFLDDLFTREVHAHFFVDDVECKIVFIKFYGLPPGPSVDG